MFKHRAFAGVGMRYTHGIAFAPKEFSMQMHAFYHNSVVQCAHTHTHFYLHLRIEIHVHTHTRRYTFVFGT